MNIRAKNKQGKSEYAVAMRRALSRKPFPKTEGRYLTREEAHNRSRDRLPIRSARS